MLGRVQLKNTTELGWSASIEKGLLNIIGQLKGLNPGRVLPYMGIVERFYSDEPIFEIFDQTWSLFYASLRAD